ncbi:uncharacterized protein LTR77_010682 [Saxophila tyrrhenica]|uniref:Uncharacterized protein n=1 Tax=Saxophila tyrrhenica TaxID=1690608 RepID=A0AAV9NWN3_9PEZI|nr:hypothetical protein LTR77_010682 [Saxophila tyrrhenica]
MNNLNPDFTSEKAPHTYSTDMANASSNWSIEPLLPFPPKDWGRMLDQVQYCLLENMTAAELLQLLHNSSRAATAIEKHEATIADTTKRREHQRLLIEVQMFDYSRCISMADGLGLWLGHKGLCVDQSGVPVLDSFALFG